MSYWDLYQQAESKKLRNKSSRQNASAQAQNNMLYGSGTTQSGSGISAAEGIARAEGAEAAGLNVMVEAQKRAEAEQRRILAEQKKEAEKARKNAIWSQVLGFGANLVAPGLGGLITSGINSLKGGQQPVTAATVAAPIPVQQNERRIINGQLSELDPNTGLWKPVQNNQYQFGQYN